MAKVEKESESPLKAIRKKCLECSAENSAEVAKCPIESCALYKYRFGVYPSTRRKIEERRAQNAV